MGKHDQAHDERVGERNLGRVSISLFDTSAHAPCISRVAMRRVALLLTILVGTLRLEAATRAVAAIGFVNEDNLSDENEQPDPRRVALIEQWLDGGFEIGNHTFSHQDLNEVGADVFERDIVRGETINRPIVERRGMKLRWFRHPYLDTGKTLG